MLAIGFIGIIAPAHLGDATSKPPHESAEKPSHATRRVDEYRKGRFGLQAARLPEGKYSLYPAVSFICFGALASFSPEHSEPNSTLSEVIGWLDSFLVKEHEKGIHLPFQTSDKGARFTLAVTIRSDEMAQSGIEGPPLSDSRRSMGHFDQTL